MNEQEVQIFEYPGHIQSLKEIISTLIAYSSIIIWISNSFKAIRSSNTIVHTLFPLILTVQDFVDDIPNE